MVPSIPPRPAPPLLSAVLSYLSIPEDNPDLILAQFSAFSKQIPLMYLILAINTWVLSTSYIATAPIWLTIYSPMVLTLVSGIRILQWWRAQRAAVTPALAALLLRRTNRLAGVLAAAFSVWALALCPYGDTLAQSHVAFYMAITVIGCIFCLMHLRSAALIVAVVVNTLFMAFFASSGNGTFVAMTVNAVLIAGTLFVILQIQYRVFTDMIAARVRAEVLAHHDSLTGLANRTSFRESLEASLARPGTRLALLFIDLDGFKMVNDTNGHLVGDALLGQVAERLRRACSGPGMAVARLGGDEFGVILDAGDIDRASSFASTLIEVIGVPYNIGLMHNLRVGASIGIATAPSHGQDVESLLSRADMALYAAKAAGKGRYSIFVPKLETGIQERVGLEALLHAALDAQDGLFVFYQPIVDLQTRRVTAREALIRWHDPRRGWISPAEFIPVAEESGLIERIGVLVLDRACREAASWTDGSRVAVNVSGAQLGVGAFAPAVRAALDRNRLAPDRLEIEITESALLRNEHDCLAELRALRSMGVRVALDDFGTGYSSLAHIRAFPFDKIKIDGSFVRDAPTRPDCAAVIGMVADVGRRLGVATVAESVETEAHLALVTAEGCSEAQGYLFGRPAPGAEDAALVAAISRSLERTPTGA